MSSGSTSSSSTFTFDVGAHGKVSAAVYRAADPVHAATLILAHGAGAPRTHPFMIDIATRIAARGVDVVTFNFLYAEVGRKMPDKVDLLEATWRAAIATVRARSGFEHSERLFIGGKSMGGRMATHIAAAAKSEGLQIDGVVLLGYPLHPVDKPKVVREEILAVNLPMLVVQGSKDELGTATEMKKMLAKMASTNPHVHLHVVADGDHSLAIPRRGVKNPDEAQSRVLDESADQIAAFVASPTKTKRKKKS